MVPRNLKGKHIIVDLISSKTQLYLELFIYTKTKSGILYFDKALSFPSSPVILKQKYD